MRQVTEDLQKLEPETLQLVSEIEKQNWRRVENDRLEARHLLVEAEWTLSIVSFLALVFSIWASFVLPRQVVNR